MTIDVCNRHVFKIHSCIVSDFFISCHQRKIGAQFCRFFIVITGSHLRDPLDLLLFHQRDLTHFRVNFVIF